MPATIRNNAEGGTNGTSVSLSNTGGTSGTLLTNVSATSGATITFSNTVGRGLAYKFSTAATSTFPYVSWGNIMPESSTVYIRFYYYMSTHNGTLTRLVELLDGSTPSICATIAIQTSGKISVRDPSGTVMIQTTTGAPVGVWIRVEAQIVSSATTGQATLRVYYEADSPYPTEVLTSTATWNTKPGATFIRTMNFGLPGIGTTNYTVYYDSIGMTDSTWLGPADPAHISSLFYYNTAEMGTNGTLVTASNTGDSANRFFNLFDSVNGTIQFSTAQAAHGTKSYQYDPGNGNYDFMSWTTFSTSSASARFYAYFTALPSATNEIFVFHTNPNVTFATIARLGLTPGGKLRFIDPSDTAIWTSTASVPLNTWVRIEIYTAIGGTASTGTVNVAFYSLDSTTPTDSYTGTANAAIGTVPIGAARFGKSTSTDWVSTFYYDDIAVQQGASGFIGPYAGAPVAPATYAGIIPHLGWGRAI